MDLKPGAISHAEKITEQFISDRFNDSGSSTAVIGVSGGLDSAVTLRLLERSIGKKNISAFFLPYGKLSGPDRDYALQSAKTCGIEVEEVDISPIVESVPLDAKGMAKGNLMARARMVFLYTFANMHNGMVIGTSNKSEILMGYFTKFGDGAADIYPIGDLFKAQVRLLAADIGVPDEIIERPPSACLIEGQTDEAEMGVPYPILDQILNGYLMTLDIETIADSMDHAAASAEEMDRADFNPPVNEDLVERIIDTVKKNRHKRSGLAIPKLQASTVGVDLRERW